MASSAIEHGFVQVPTGLFAALMALDLRTRARLVLSYVLAHRFGPEKVAVVDLSPTCLARLSGLDKSNASAGVRDLVAAGVLTRLACGGYALVEDYDQWTERDVPFVSRWAGGLGEFLAWTVDRFWCGPGAMERRNRAMAASVAARHLDRPVVQTDHERGSNRPHSLSEQTTNVVQTDHTGVVQTDHECGSNGHPPWFKRTTNVVQTDTAPYKGTRAELNTESIQNTETGGELAGARTSPPPPAPAVEPVVPRVRVFSAADGRELVPGDSAPVVSPGWGTVLSPDQQAELDLAARFAVDQFGDWLALRMQGEPLPVRGMAVAWWLPALKEMARAARGKQRWPYLLGILKGFVARGGPRLDPEPPVKDRVQEGREAADRFLASLTPDELAASEKNARDMERLARLERLNTGREQHAG